MGKFSVASQLLLAGDENEAKWFKGEDVKERNKRRKDDLVNRAF